MFLQRVFKVSASRWCWAKHAKCSQLWRRAALVRCTDSNKPPRTGEVHVTAAYSLLDEGNFIPCHRDANALWRSVFEHVWTLIHISWHERLLGVPNTSSMSRIDCPWLVLQISWKIVGKHVSNLIKLYFQGTLLSSRSSPRYCVWNQYFYCVEGSLQIEATNSFQTIWKDSYITFNPKLCPNISQYTLHFQEIEHNISFFFRITLTLLKPMTT